MSFEDIPLRPIENLDPEPPIDEKGEDIFTINNQERIKDIQKKISTIDLSQIEYGKDGLYICKGISLISHEREYNPYSFSQNEFQKYSNLPGGVQFTFAQLKPRNWNHGEKEKDISPLDDSFHQNYIDALIMISSIKDRQLDLERKVLLLKNLENRRRDIHNQGADEVVRNMEWSSMTTSVEAARKIYEILTELWLLKNEESISISADDSIYGEVIDDLDLEALGSRITQETGVSAVTSFFIYGYHEDSPRRQISIDLKGDSIKLRLPEIHKIIEEEFDKMLGQK